MWLRAVHEDGRTYYINEDTDKTSWTLPEGFAEGDIEDYVSESESDSGSSSDSDDEAAAAAAVGGAAVAKSSWVRCTHDDGRTYYMNEDTDKTSWTLPEGFTEAQIADFVSESESSEDEDVTAAAKPPTPPAGGKCPWSRCTHDDGRTYYMNEETEKTSWTLPEGFKEEDIVDFVSDDSESDSEEDSGTASDAPGDGARGEGACPWQRTTHDDGRVYYMNFDTDETSWVLPAGWAADQIEDYVESDSESSDAEEEDAEVSAAVVAAAQPKKAKRKKKIAPKTAWALSETALLAEKAKSGSKKKRAKRRAQLPPPTSSMESGTVERRANKVTSITVGAKAKKAFSAMKKKRKYDRIVLKIDVATSTLEVESKGQGGYDHLKSKKGKKALPSTACRYVLLDTGRKIFLVVWMPRSAPSDAIAMYNLQAHKVAAPFIGATKVNAKSLPELLKMVGGAAARAAVADEDSDDWDPDA